VTLIARLSGRRQPQEARGGTTLAASCAFGTPIGKLSGPPAIIIKFGPLLRNGPHLARCARRHLPGGEEIELPRLYNHIASQPKTVSQPRMLMAAPEAKLVGQ
jgi:hypothetical protein